MILPIEACHHSGYGLALHTNWEKASKEIPGNIIKQGKFEDRLTERSMAHEDVYDGVVSAAA